MTSTGPRKLIRCENFYLRKGSLNGSDNGNYSHFPPSRNDRSQPPAIQTSRTDPDFDEQLRTFENNSHNKFINIKNNLRLKKLPGRLDHRLEQTVLPTLQRIGYDELIAKTLFELTPAEWKFMNPVNEKIIVLHPEINHQINDVLQGLRRKMAKDNENLRRLEGHLPPVMTGTIGKNLSPEHLFELLDEIDTSWITLPRVFRFLAREHHHYLPQYLETIENQTGEPCLKVFSRITTEFLGNFALKFADGHHSPDQIEKLLFYGYSAMYWKNLRQPPLGMENSAAFDHFLNWANRLSRRSRLLGSDEVRLVHQMLKMKCAVFPKLTINQTQTGSRKRNSRFVVTLRHGNLGAATISRYFRIDQFLGTRQTHGQSPFQSRQNQLHGLLVKIQTNYHRESKRTRRYIRQFIAHLKSAYEKSQLPSSRPERRFLYRMINNLHILYD